MKRRSARAFGFMAAAVVLLAGCGSDGGDSVSGDPTLTSLAVSAGALTPAFDPTVTEYSVDTVFATTTTTVTATPTEATAGVTVNGAALTDPVALVEGVNKVRVRVITAGGAVKVYTVTVNRESIVNFVQQAYAKASNTGAGDQFGYSVALDGDTLAVGAPFEDSAAIGINGTETNNSATSAGAVYVFVRSSGVWTQEAYIKASNTGAGDQFGWSVALSGNTLAVGAPLEDSNATGVNGDGTDNTAADSGAAYVFVRTGTTWTQEAYVKASNTDARDQFGWSVALSGDTLAVGALLEDGAATGVNGNDGSDDAANSGAAYVFVRSGTVWAQEAYVKASNTGVGDDFGVSVALSGDTLAVGATGESSAATGIGGQEADNSAFSAGAVYVFVRSGGVWTQEAYIKASNTNAGDVFGWSLALDANTLAVGAPLEDGSATGIGGTESSNGAASAGAAYVFVRSGATWTQEAYVKASNTDAGDYFGWRVALSGDTLAVGAPAEDSGIAGVDANQSDNSAATAGAVYVFLRTLTTWGQQDYVKPASNPSSLDGFGSGVALSVDTVAVGAVGEDSAATGINGDAADNSAALSGAVYVFQ